MKRLLKSPKLILLLGLLLLGSLGLSRWQTVCQPDKTRERFNLVIQILEGKLLRSDLRSNNSTIRTSGPQVEK